MRAGLSSNPSSPTLIVGPVRMLAVVRAENSWRVLSAIASNLGVKLRLIWLSSDSKAETFLSLALVLMGGMTLDTDGDYMGCTARGGPAHKTKTYGARHCSACTARHQG